MVRCGSNATGQVGMGSMAGDGAIVGTPPVAVVGCVRGRVQGVSFRYSMQRMATGFGVTGWVRNLPDRSVAFHAEGLPDAVTSLMNWCQTGPTFARVDDVDVDPGDVCRFESFEILP
ncbi:MAG: acylphosphatase [Gammaproteobacteria bacterium]|nr:acylphosphatase [Gammaproteobacteria bacterium]